MSQQSPLQERKRRRTREAIIDAAFALFAEETFSEVSVGDIAERAEVGRTTFFRYFGDKQEVLFAGEQRILAKFSPLSDSEPAEGLDFMRALQRARDVVLGVCQDIVSNPDRYRLRDRLIEENPGLQDRNQRKLLALTDALALTLRAQGASEPDALLAAHVAIACYRAGKALAGPDPSALTPAVEAAFDRLLLCSAGRCRRDTACRSPAKQPGHR